jgi:hypothetical protein
MHAILAMFTWDLSEVMQILSAIQKPILHFGVINLLGLWAMPPVTPQIALHEYVLDQIFTRNLCSSLSFSTNDN